ncbi:MAG: alkaline phosphatase family protein, partial [Myxococcota bacterium]
VIVIGIDGLGSDALQAASTPNLDALIASGTASMAAFAGGVPGTPTEQPTLSGPGWTSVLTGVWRDKHGVSDNSFAGERLAEFPHVFARIREAKPSAKVGSFVSWGPLNAVLLRGVAVDRAFHATASESRDRDAEVVASASEYLRTANPTAVFVHLGDVDHAGHTLGFQPDNDGYRAAIERADARVGRLAAAMRARPNYGNEAWLVVVVSDHGGVDTRHGGQRPRERHVPLIVSGHGVGAWGKVDVAPGLTAVVPTVLGHLQVPIDPALHATNPTSSNAE